MGHILPRRSIDCCAGASESFWQRGYTHVLPGWQRDAMNRLEREVLFPNVPKSEKESEERDSETVGVPTI
jgi:hypothetical protein